MASDSENCVFATADFAGAEMPRVLRLSSVTSMMIASIKTCGSPTSSYLTILDIAMSPLAGKMSGAFMRTSAIILSGRRFEILLCRRRRRDDQVCARNR